MMSPIERMVDMACGITEAKPIGTKKIAVDEETKIFMEAMDALAVWYEERAEDEKDRLYYSGGPIRRNPTPAEADLFAKAKAAYEAGWKPDKWKPTEPAGEA